MADKIQRPCREDPDQVGAVEEVAASEEGRRGKGPSSAPGRHEDAGAAPDQGSAAFDRAVEEALDPPPKELTLNGRLVRAAPRAFARHNFGQNVSIAPR